MERLTRRRDVLIGAATLLAGCDAGEPRRGALGAMGRFTEAAEAGLFQARREASAPGRTSTTPLADFPAYKIGARYPNVPPDWSLHVGGMVARPRRFSAQDLQRMTRTDVRVRHHCVEGWSAVASWHGVRLGDLAEIVGAEASAPYVEFVSFELTPEAGGGLATTDDAKDKSDQARPRMKAPTYTS